MKTTGFAYDSRFLDHNPGTLHPECPGRLEGIVARLSESGMLNDLSPVEPVTTGDWPVSIHSQKHIESVAALPVTGKTARLAISYALGAVAAVAGGKLSNAFCALRPPGHHAHNNGAHWDGEGQGEGFCFYNTIAEAARYAQKKCGLERVLIVDWDYHHGNGTEWAFYSDPSVLFFSTHALYDYPGTGSPDRIGAGDGRGCNINVPLERGAGDADIFTAFEDELLERAEAFGPDIILISAGFDSRIEDTLGTFQITDEGFLKLTQMVTHLARIHCGGRVVSFLEGGYNLQTLPLAVEVHLRGLMEAP